MHATADVDLTVKEPTPLRTSIDPSKFTIAALRRRVEQLEAICRANGIDTTPIGPDGDE